MSLASNISGLEDFDKKIAEANADFDKRKPKDQASGSLNINWNGYELYMGALLTLSPPRA
jgi:hypothetical protein